MPEDADFAIQAYLQEARFEAAFQSLSSERGTDLVAHAQTA
jgi:hypothetical protein